MDACLTPTIIFEFLDWQKVDWSSFFDRYLGHYDIYMVDD